jgi:diguanylate cyclase (GGDEF)-like protein/PAS domain S-box-containing protein
MPDSDAPPDRDDETTQLEDRIKALENDLQQKREIILAQHTKLEAFFESSIDALVQMDFDGHITGWNRQAEKIFGWQADDILDRKIEQTIIPERYRAAHLAAMQRYLRSGETTVMDTLVEIHALHRDGHEFPVELSVSVIDSPELQEFNAYIRDISERKQAEDVIWKQANFDSLTGLPNRNLFLQKLADGIRSCDRSRQSLALLYLDLDRFKDVNDTLGHAMGDLLLVEIARRLQSALRQVDTVARLGGDEFTVILGNISDQLAVQPICQSLLDELAQPFQLENEKLFLTASIGVSFYPQDASEVGELQRFADQAMYAAKTEGSNRYHFFTPELQRRALRKRKMINELRDAIDGRQFEILYQPIVALDGGRMHKAEALIRWLHPERGELDPDAFIPIAEDAGLIAEIGNWVFYQAITEAARWREAFAEDFQISVNISPMQWLDNAAAMDQWRSHLQAAGIAGQALIIEITERLLIEARDRIAGRLMAFRESGIQVSIDDFGTGYASLSYLRQYDIDYLKIDHSFIHNLDRDERDLALCEAVIAMAHKLGIEVIAEGVENETQQSLLVQFGCDYAQGHLYSRPLPAAEFELLLERQAKRDRPLDG